MLTDANPPRLGQEHQATLVRQTGPNEWEVDCYELPKPWSATLRSRSSKTYMPGDTETLWVFAVYPITLKALLSDSDFGRLPISNRMRPRYIQALQSTLQLLEQPGRALETSPEHLSELKGMFNRCLRKDQWDWLTVYTNLGSPSQKLSQVTVERLVSLRRAMKGADIEDLDRSLSQFIGLKLETRLGECIRLISGSGQHLQDLTQLKPYSANSLTTELDPDTLPENEGYLMSQVSRAKLDRANTDHQRTLAILTRTLEAQGFTIEHSRLVDAYTNLKSGPAIFEVKSIHARNELSQCRKALSQLYEYRYLHGVPDASLWLVLSSPPYTEWIAGYLQTDRNIEVLWVTGDQVHGPSRDRLFRSS